MQKCEQTLLINKTVKSKNEVEASCEKDWLGEGPFGENLAGQRGSITSLGQKMAMDAA